MRDIWSFLYQTLTASGVAVLLLAVKAMLRDKLPPRWQFASWSVMVLALLLPAGLGGRYALLNWPLYVETLKSVLTGDYTLTRVTAPVPLPPKAPPATVWDWLFVVYAAGVMVLLAWYFLAFLRLRLALRRGRPASEEQMGRMRETAERYNLPICRCVEVDGLPSAFLCGVFSPVLALPAGEAVDEKVFLHELLHLKYRDTAWGVVITLLRCLHWCNPLVWYCADRAGNDLEARCDQRVLELLEGEARRDYGRILLSMANDKYARTPGTSTMANGGRNIRLRVEAIARFKRYPAGMGLVSVCVLILLASSVAVGAGAGELRGADEWGPWGVERAMAAARLTRCETYAGAFDTYAKSILEGNDIYRAACAPMADQKALAGALKERGDVRMYTHWDWDGCQRTYPDVQSGYGIYRLEQVGEEAYEGILALDLSIAPEGESDDGWKAVQALRCEKEGERWVVRPLEEFRAVKEEKGGRADYSLPFRCYEATYGAYTIRLIRQTICRVKAAYVSTGQPLFGSAVYDTTPVLDGTFVVDELERIQVRFEGEPWPEEGSTVGVSTAPWDGVSPRPGLGFLKDREFGMSNNQGELGGNQPWPAQRAEWVWVAGGGTLDGTDFTNPDAYAADLWLDGVKVAELTLLPTEGGGL